MARVTGPLFSLTAANSIAETITYYTVRGIACVRQYFVPANPNTVAQQARRTIFTWAVNGWHNILSAANRLEWRDAEARPPEYTAMNYYVSEYIQAIDAGTTPPVSPS